MKIAVTGINGYIGRNLAELVLRNGVEILALSRSRPIFLDDSIGWMEFNLAHPKEIFFPNDLKVVVHLATQVNNFSTESVRKEIQATTLLIDSATRVGARFIFISSQTADLNAASKYGQIKWEIERLVLNSGGIVIRPGQVYGGIPGGLYLKLLKMGKNKLILPKLLPAPSVQPIYIGDLTAAIYKLLNFEGCSGQIYSLGSPVPVSFDLFLKTIIGVKKRNCIVSIPVPTIFPLLLSKIFTKNQKLQQLKSLIYLKPMDTKSSLDALEIPINPFPSGLDLSNKINYRKLILEGFIFYRYLLGFNPPLSFLRNYKKAIISLSGGCIIELPSIYASCPWVLRLVNINKDGRKFDRELANRIHIASVLAEASQMGAVQFSGIGMKFSFMRSLCEIFSALSQEALWRIAGILCRPFLKMLKLYPGQ